jgi:TPR repeat protein
MKTRLVSLAFAALLLSWSIVSFAGEFDDGLAAYNRGDYKTALALFTKAANKGDAAAQTGLGLMYSYGEGVPQDYNQAMLWFRKAADQGYAKAQYILGAAYNNGQGVPQDYNQAASWFRKARIKATRRPNTFLG